MCDCLSHSQVLGPWAVRPAWVIVTSELLQSETQQWGPARPRGPPSCCSLPEGTLCPTWHCCDRAGPRLAEGPGAFLPSQPLDFLPALKWSGPAFPAAPQDGQKMPDCAMAQEFGKMGCFPYAGRGVTAHQQRDVYFHI